MSLTPPQIRAAELLSRGYTQEEVGKAVGVSRRTVLRWLKQQDFKNLSYGLVGRAQSPQQTPQRTSDAYRQSHTLSPQDLVGDALEAVRDILQNPDTRNVDKLRAASLVGSWSGLGDREKMHELEALKILIEAGWLPSRVIDSVAEAADYFELKAKEAFSAKDESSSQQIGF